MVDPSLLHGGKPVGTQAFDGRDFGTLDRSNRRHATALRLPVHMNGASSALRDAAAEFGAGKPQFIADDPEQRRIRLDLEGVLHTIYLQLERHASSCVSSCLGATQHLRAAVPGSQH